MKLLVLPIYTAKKISRCVSYFWLREYAKTFLKQFPNSFVYFVVPDEKSGFLVDDLVQDKRWINIPMPFAISRYRNIFLPKDEYLDFGCWGKYWDWDCVFTTLSNGFWWRCLASGGTSPSIKKTAILGEVFPLMSFKKTFSMSPHYLTDYRALEAYLHFDKIYIKTEFEKKGILNIARNLLSPSMYNKIAEKIEVAFNENDDLDYDYPLSKEAKENFLSGDFTVVYPQRISDSQKRFDYVYKVLWYIFCGLRKKKITFRVFTNSTADLPFNDTKFMVFERPSRQEFWNLLKKTHLFISWSKEEGMPSALLESVVNGNIGIVKREKWSEDLFGKEYKFFVQSKEEAIAKILDIYENPEKNWEVFVEWYKIYFLNLIKERANHYKKQTDFIINAIENKKELIEKSKRTEVFGVAKLIHESKYDEIDLFNLPKFPELTKPLVSDKDRDLDKVLFSKVPNRYGMKFILNHFFGWIDTEKAGVLKRK